jgi:hypothetical protein
VLDFPSDRTLMIDDSTQSTSRRGVLAAVGGAVGGLTLGGTGFARHRADEGDDDGGRDGSGGRRYRVTVANLTSRQPFSPPAVVVHDPRAELFSVGEEASPQLKALAENGNLGPLARLAASTDGVAATAVGDGPLAPKRNPNRTEYPSFAELHLAVGADADVDTPHLSFVASLVATNDGFVGLDAVELPGTEGASTTRFVQAYDAGTERNTGEFADLIPAAQRLTGQTSLAAEGTLSRQPELAEGGVVTPHPGLGSEGSLEFYDWTEPAASVVVERIE